MRGYIVTDGYNEMAICASQRSKATGVFIRHFAKSHINWRDLRTTRAPDIDGDDAWELDSGAFSTVEWWGTRVRLP
jgi:hypothetical protein